MGLPGARPQYRSGEQRQGGLRASRRGRRPEGVRGHHGHPPLEAGAGEGPGSPVLKEN